MKYFFGVFLLITITFGFACSPTEKEKADIRKSIEDSIRNVQDRAVTVRKLNSTLIGLNTLLKNSNADLDVAYDKMNDIKGFQFLRSQSERETQIRNQDITIQSINERIKRLSESILKVQNDIKMLNPNAQF